MRKWIPLALALSLLVGCGSPAASQSSAQSTDRSEVSSSGNSSLSGSGQTGETVLPDGVYSAKFETDSSMFHVNEACDGLGTLTVEDGRMTIHVSLVSKNVVNLYPGTAEEAQMDGAVWLEPTVDTVTYSDGISEEVYGFDVPVPAIGVEFDLALIGSKGTWYDHKVSVRDPQPVTRAETPEDGVYTCAVTLEGGSGRTTVESPAALRVEGGAMFATLVWDSPNYDYMKVDGVQYLAVSNEGTSVFEVPVAALDTPLAMVADTVAMSTPHEVEYTLTFHSDSLQGVTP